MKNKNYTMIAVGLMLAIPMSGYASMDAFINESKMDVIFKNYWKYLKEDEANPKEVHNAWGQGILADYKSGYFLDIIGFDATYYSAIKLGASDYFNTRGVLSTKGTGHHSSNATGYSKFGQRNIKLRYDLAELHLDARWGWQEIKNLGVISSSTRLSPTTYLGWRGELHYQGFTLRGAYIENSIDRNSADKKRFQTQDGKDINHIASGDIRWKNNLLTLQYGYGESDNYLRRHLLFANLKPLPQLTLGTQIYGTYAQARYKDMAINRRDFDHDAWHFAVDAKWQGQRWSSKWGLGYTEAKKENRVGFYPRHMSRNSRGTFASMASAGSDYMRDGELVLSTMSDYKLTPELSLGVTANIAQFNYKNNAVRSGEISAFSRWAPTHPSLKNLSVWAIAGPGWSYKNSAKTPILTDGRYSRTHSLASEVIIEYRFGAL